MKTALFVVAFGCLLCGAAAIVALVGRRRFRGRVTADVTALFSDAGVSIGSNQRNARWDGLPEPVRRYLRYAIREGASAIRTVRLKHDGFFRTTPEQRWFPIEGEQYFTVARPGFVWNASIRPAPLVWIEARDRLVSGRGNMLVKLVSTFSIADAVGPEIDQGSRLRWLAECAWFPYAFVGVDVQWEQIDAHSARARLRCDGLPVGALVEVDDEGKLTKLRADRYRDVGGGRSVLTPWTGRYFDYREYNGFRVPSSVEAGWELEKELFLYVRFRVTVLEYDVARRFS